MTAAELTLEDPMVQSFCEDGCSNPEIFVDWLEDQGLDHGLNLPTMARLFRGTEENTFRDGIPPKVLGLWLKRRGYLPEGEWVEGMHIRTDLNPEIALARFARDPFALPGPSVFNPDADCHFLYVPPITGSKLKFAAYADTESPNMLIELKAAYATYQNQHHIGFPLSVNPVAAMKEIVFSLEIFAPLPHVRKQVFIGYLHIRGLRDIPSELEGGLGFDRKAPVEVLNDWENNRISVSQSLPLYRSFGNQSHFYKRADLDGSWHKLVVTIMGFAIV